MINVTAIQCKECQFFRENDGYCTCTYWSNDEDAIVDPEGYCSAALPEDDVQKVIDVDI